MKKKVLSLILSLVMVFGVFVFVPAATLPVVADTWNASAATPTITTNADMTAFASAVSGGNTFAGKTVVLAGNVNLTSTVGDTDHPFMGNFDGRGYTVTITQSYTNQPNLGGLFSQVATPNGGTVTIQNVKVAGTITLKANSNDSNDTHGGLISTTKFGTSSGGACTLNIINCWSSVQINAQTSRVGTTGGFIGWIGHQDGYLPNGTVNFESCVWDGYMNWGSASADVGGFIGNTGLNKSGRVLTINMKNCVASGRIALNVNWSDNTGLIIGMQKCNYSSGTTTVNVENMVCTAKYTSSVTITSSKWVAYFNRQNTNYGVVNLKNFYYYQHNCGGFSPIPLTPSSGGAITSSTNVVAKSNQTTDFTGLTSSNFSEPLKWLYKGTYSVNGSSASGMPIPSMAYGVFTQGMHTHLTDQTATTFNISSTTDLMNFGKAVNNCALNFSGKTVKLTTNVSLSGQTWASVGNRTGNGEGLCFRGTFDGQNYSIAEFKSAAQSVDDTGAFFGDLGDGAIVKNVWFKAPSSGYNVTVSGGSGSWRYFSSMLANCCWGTVQITNVRNSMTLNSSYNSSTVGSFVGFMDNTVNTTLTISGCVFDGRMDFGNYTDDIGGFVGATGNNWGSTKKLTIENCLFAGTIGLNTSVSYSAVAGYLGHANFNTSGSTQVTIQKCVSTGRISFLNTANWSNENYGSCGQVVGTVTNNSNVSVTISDVYYNPSYLHMTANTASTKRYLGEIGNNKGTYKVDVAGAHFCTPIDLAALTTSNLSSSWTVGSVTSSTVTAPVPTYAKTNLSLTAPTFTNTTGYVSATGKNTSKYSGSITFKVDFTSGVSNFGTKNVNCGVILISNTKFKALASSGAIDYSTLTAANCGTRIAGLKGTVSGGTSTMKVVISQFTSNSTKQSEEYFVIPYIGTTIYLDGARLIAYNAL